MIYSFFNTLIKGYLKYRKGRIQSMLHAPYDLQNEVFFDLLTRLKNTNYGKKYSVSNVKNLQDFKKAFPVTDYEHLLPYIDKNDARRIRYIMARKTTWFAKSSGTTNDKKQIYSYHR
ncbi:MAG: GH3 auxin-responsive promoter family protein [Saprospiraceae bacterium]|nr:GH3 auxin-responsive promoter family protein [Saprospiraceae bacterium]